MLPVVHGVNTAAQLNPTWNTPAGYTATYADNTVASGSGSNDSLYVAQAQPVTPGSTGTVTVSVTAAQTTLNGFLVSIKSKPNAPTKKGFITGSNAGSQKFVTVVTPAAAVGDLVLMVYSNNYRAYADIADPVVTGTPAQNFIGGRDNGLNSFHLKAWWCLVNTAGAQTVTVTETGIGDEEKCLSAYVIGNASASPVDDFKTGLSTVTATPWVAPAVTATGPADFVIAHVGSSTNFHNRTVTVGAPLTSDAAQITDANWTYACGSVSLAAAGTAGPYNFTPSGAEQYVSCTIAIK